MKQALLLSALILFSVSARAEQCEGFSSCAELYTKITGEKLSEDARISDEMTLAVPNTDLTKENAKVEYTLYLNKNAVLMGSNHSLMAVRKGEFLTAPIYIVSKNNMPQMLNKDGLVTLVYRSEKDTKRLVSAKVRGMLSKGKVKAPSVNSVTELKDSRIVVVCDTFEYATKVMNEIMKADK